MLNQDQVRSGYDIEILLGARQLTYVLLGLVDAGNIPAELPGAGTVFLPRVIDRTYAPNLEALSKFAANPTSDSAFEVEILFDNSIGADLRVRIFIGGVSADVYLTIKLVNKLDADGIFSDATLSLVLLDIQGANETSILYLLTRREEFLTRLREEIDQEVTLSSLGVAKRLDAIQLLKLHAEGDHPAAYGIYINLRLQDGDVPGTLRAARGQIEDAVNFLPAGSDLAMASRKGLFDDLAKDLFDRTAEIDADGNVSHPFRENFLDKGSKVIGSIKGVSVAPLPPPPPAVHSNIFRVRFEVETDSVWPVFYVNIDLSPVVNDQGVLVWNLDADYSTGVIAELAAFVAIGLLTGGIGVLFVGVGLTSLVGFGLIGGTLADAVTHTVGQEILDSQYSGKVKGIVDASLPEVLSGRIELVRRRWDPLYTTIHDVAMRPDGALVNDSGLALWGRAVLDRRVEPLPHAVLRDKLIAAPDGPSHLLYRVRDAVQEADSFSQLAPGTDRRNWIQPSASQPTLIQLTLEQVVARIAEGRLIKNIPMVAKQIEVTRNTVTSIMTLSALEIAEKRGELIAAFRQSERARLAASLDSTLREQVLREFMILGVTPTNAQVTQRMKTILDALLPRLVEAGVEVYTEGDLAHQLELALPALMRFDLSPQSMAGLQLLNVLHLPGLVIVRRHSDNPYYRDQADAELDDNLKALPRYRTTA